MGGYAVIYLDHAATTPVRPEVAAAMAPFYEDSFANASSSYAAARASRRAIDQARAQVAAAIGAKRSEIYFTSGGSEADNWAMFGAAAACPEKKHIITTCIEHHAVLFACKALERFGCSITYLPVDRFGRVSPADVRSAIRPDTLMISVMLANNEIGTIEPIGEISAIAREAGVLMHTDAVQAVGHLPVDVSSLGVDMLSMSSHKFYGPKGIGALYIRDGVRMGRMIFGGAQERGMRAGTENTPAIVGMGKAVELACGDMEQEKETLLRLRMRLMKMLGRIPGVRINGDPDCSLPGIVHATIDDADTSMLLMQMDMNGIAVSAGSACTSGAAERSHVIEALGFDGSRQADIRFSIGRQNTENDIVTAAETLRRCLKR